LCDFRKEQTGAYYSSGDLCLPSIFYDYSIHTFCIILQISPGPALAQVSTWPGELRVGPGPTLLSVVSCHRQPKLGSWANFVSGQPDIARPYTCRRAARSPHQSLEDATAATTLGERWGAAPTSSEEVQATAPTSAVGAGKQLCRPVAPRLCARQ
jgi:hypothetical protein